MPASPKVRSTDQEHRPLISPKGRPPPTIAIPSQKLRQSGAPAAAIGSPRSVSTADTAYLEEKLERKREAKRSGLRHKKVVDLMMRIKRNTNVDHIIRRKNIV